MKKHRLPLKYNYGIIGNCTSAALVSSMGSIDWLCLPKFDSASVFAKILDEEIGGSFSFEVENLKRIKQRYIRNTNLLCSRFESDEGIFEVIDFMPRYRQAGGGYYCPPDVVRYIKVINGSPRIKVFFTPKLEYGKYHMEIEVYEDYLVAVTKEQEYDSLYLYSDLDLQAIVLHESIILEKDCFFLMSYNQKLFPQYLDRILLKMERTKVYWLGWVDRTVSFDKYDDIIKRSALTLKLLSYHKTGAFVAALTTSLPETIGEVRNWDYRFCWIRDSSMVVKVLTRLGHNHAAHRFMHYIIDLLPEKGDAMQVMYGINGERKLTEYELSHLSGYANSKPVRIGNAAYSQTQNDIYGILMDVIYQHLKMYKTTLAYSEELWTVSRQVVRIVEKNWHQPDKGIWEIRNESKHFTFSKVLCWVAVDRARKIAELLNQEYMAECWQRLEDEIRQEIEEKAWNKELQAYTQAYDSEDMDASVLLMERYGFVKAEDERFRKTVYAIMNELEHEGLMYRYKNKDDFGLPQSAFTICSFWLINALYKIGEKEMAKERFEQILKYSNHLQLYSEDLDFKTKRQLGNFPQAYSHLALIETAITLSEDKVSSEAAILDAIG
jgi:GH15 family glucan-1,4-alpha-glucosidase